MRGQCSLDSYAKTRRDSSLTDSDRIVLVHTILYIIDVTTRLDVVDSNESCAEGPSLANLFIAGNSPVVVAPVDHLNP